MTSKSPSGETPINQQTTLSINSSKKLISVVDLASSLYFSKDQMGSQNLQKSEVEGTEQEGTRPSSMKEMNF